jgi:hypothetical protein
MSANATICTAIDSMKVIEFDYADEKGNLHHRVVEPYAHGVTKRGKDALRGRQIGGTSESGVLDWRLFLIAGMIGLRITKRSFAVHHEYAHGDKDLNPIYCRVP